MAAAPHLLHSSKGLWSDFENPRDGEGFFLVVKTSMVKLKIKNSPDSWARPEELPRKRLAFFQQQCKFFGLGRVRYFDAFRPYPSWAFFNVIHTFQKVIVTLPKSS
jgi:hypothetical protein